MARALRFTSPVVGPQVLARPRLLHRLNERWHRRVVVITAGPGFGKTTLLAQAAEESALDAPGVDVWITCEASDASGVTLTRDLAQALGLRPADDEVVEVERLADAVWQRAPQEVAILLDDVQEVPAGSAGADVIAALVASLPGNGHVVLAGRTDPPVPLRRLAAQGEVTSIDEDQLRLTSEEVDAIAAERGTPVDALAGLAGWPALTELALAAGVETAREFVWEEILHNLDPGQRRAFASLVAVGGGDAAVASAAAGHDVDLHALVDGLPLIARRAGGDAYPHRLWDEIVDGELGADEVDGARRRAAAVLHVQGAHDRAVELLAAARDWAAISASIIEACTTGRPLWVDRLADRWLELLPPGPAHDGERLLLAGIRGRVRLPSDEAVPDLLLEAAERFRHRDDADGELAALAHLGYVAWIRHDVERLATCLGRGIELEREGLTMAGFFRALASALLAGRAGDFEAALAELEPVVGLRLNGEWSGSVASLHAMTLTMLGRPDEAVEHARRASARPEVEGAGVYEHLTLWFAGRAEEVLAALPLAGAGSQSVYDRLLSQLTTALCQAHAGLVDEADALHAACRDDVARYPDRPFTSALHVIVAAAAATGRGDEARARALLRTFLAEHPLDDTSIEQALRRFHPLVYALLPETRPFWDAQAYGPAWQQARDVARALAAVREGGSPPAVRCPPGRVLTSLPLVLSVELALGLMDEGDEHGRSLLSWLVDVRGTETREALRSLAGSDHPAAKAAKHALASVPVPPPVPLRLALLGPAELWRGDERVEAPDWQRERVRMLLLYLAVHRRVSRDELAGVLWPSFTPEAAAKNLRTTLSYLQAILEPGRVQGDAPYFLRQDGAFLSLHADDQLHVDAWELESLLDEAEAADDAGTPSRALASLLAALRLWRGEYLDDVRYEEWARPHQDRMRARIVQAGVRAGELLVPIGRADEAADVATRVLTIEPWSEAAYRVLIAAHLGRGDRASARRAVERCREMLADLDVSAEPATARAIRAVLGSAAGSPATR